jgi:hypothetical protein
MSLHPILATSYPGFWLLIPIAILVLAALPVGMLSILMRWRKIAITCGAIWLIFGIWFVVAGILDGTSDSYRVIAFGIAWMVIGCFFMVFRRRIST